MQPFLLHSRKDVFPGSVKQAMIQALLLTYICLYVSFGGAGFMLYMPTFKACEELGTLCDQNLPLTYFLTTFPPLVQIALCCCPSRLYHQRCIVTGSQFWFQILMETIFQWAAELHAFSSFSPKSIDFSHLWACNSFILMLQAWMCLSSLWLERECQACLVIKTCADYSLVSSPRTQKQDDTWDLFIGVFVSRLNADFGRSIKWKNMHYCKQNWLAFSCIQLLLSEVLLSRETAKARIRGVAYEELWWQGWGKVA